MKIKNISYKNSVVALLMLCLAFTTGCKNYLEIPLPTDRLAADGAYGTDNAAAAVITGILLNASVSTFYGGPNNNESLGYRSSLYVDDLQLLNPALTSNTTYNTNNFFFSNSLTSANSTQWTTLYLQLYRCNLAIEGINDNADKLPHKNQWLGEGLFLRALTLFDLTNLYGDIPVSTTSNYLVNNVIARSPKAVAYAQIIADLKQAESLLGTTYLDGFSVVSVNRARPNQFVAAALLARAYLYTGDWVNAEAEATKVINNTTAYQLLPPASVFLANSKETILMFAPTSTTAQPVRDYGIYNGGMPAVNATIPAMAVYSESPISQSLFNTFEAGDTRFTNWLRISTTTTPAASYYFPAKYKSNVAGTEYNIILRFAEQYLIRAEARANLNTNLQGAKDDLNAIRNRSGLPNTTATLQPDILTAIAKERRVELFTEMGHRFYDLKRTNNIDAVMNIAAPLKGGTWNSQKQIWPIPAADIIANPNLTQAPGYN